MKHCVIRQEFCIPVANDSANLNHGSSFRVCGEGYWSDMWIQFSPLPGPIIPHGIWPMQTPALPAVWPIYVRMEGGQHPIDLASIEGCI